MNSYKRFFWSVVGVVSTLVLFSFLIWYFVTKPILSGNPDIGDLSRLGYLPELLQLDKEGNPPGGKHLEYWEYDGQPVDVVTLGDSFSQGGGGNYYQDYIAGEHGVSVLNLTEIFWYPGLHNRFDPVVNLLNAGLFDTIKPRYLLLQSVERYGAQLAMDVDWQAESRADDYLSFMEDTKNNSRSVPQVSNGFFNTASFKYLVNLITYDFLGHNYNATVYKSDLKSELFTSEAKSEFAFFYQDIKWANSDTAQIAEKVNVNLNHLAALLAERGIQLIFMPAVDRLDLYSDYMVNQDYPRPHFFEKLRTLPKDYILIDTKKILATELAKGEKDIFWPDDTHWSWKASLAIAESLSLEKQE